MPEESVEGLLMSFGQEPLSLETPVGFEGDDATLRDSIEDRTSDAPLDAVARGLCKRDLEDTLEQLDDRERRILEMRYSLDDGDPMTLDDIGGRIGVTRERVRQIESLALVRLRRAPRLQRLAEPVA